MTDKQTQLEEWIQREIEGVSLERCLIDPRKDYRRPLNQYKQNRHGDLMILRHGQWEVLIERERLTEPEWIAHLRAKQYISDGNNDFGNFVRAYCKALERLGIKSLVISVYGFDCSSKYADET